MQVTAASMTPVTMPVTSVPDNGLPLHLQNDLIMAHDMQTGEIVYIRTSNASKAPTNDVVIVHDPLGLPSTNSLSSITLLSDAPRAVAVPMSEWSTGPTPSTSSGTMLRSLDTTSTPRPTRSSSRIKAKSAVSPWIVDEPPHTTPLMNGDVSFTPTHGTMLVSQNDMKQEPQDSGPPVLTSSEFQDALANGVTFLPSNAILSNTNLPSLTGLFSSTALDEHGSLLSSSVFEMVQPYIENRS
jgi:hypothetical protein